MPLSKGRICPNCGEKMMSSYCQWCGYLIRRDSPIGETSTQQTDRTTAKEAKGRAKQEAKALAKGTKERAKWKVKEKARKAVQIIEAAKEKTKREAQRIIKEAANWIVITGQIMMATGQIIKEAKEKTRREAQRIINETRKDAEVPPVTPVTARKSKASKSYQGKIKLAIISPIDFTQLMKFQEHLRQVPELVLLSVGGSAAGTEIIVSVDKPISLVQVLKGMPSVKQAVKKGEGIEVTLGSS